jgi:protoheme ferro-lyase
MNLVRMFATMRNKHVKRIETLERGMCRLQDEHEKSLVYECISAITDLVEVLEELATRAK